MAYMCKLGFGECDACGYCSDWDEDDNEVFHDDEDEENEEDEEDY